MIKCSVCGMCNIKSVNNLKFKILTFYTLFLYINIRSKSYPLYRYIDMREFSMSTVDNVCTDIYAGLGSIIITICLLTH